MQVHLHSMRHEWKTDGCNPSTTEMGFLGFLFQLNCRKTELSRKTAKSLAEAEFLLTFVLQFIHHGLGNVSEA